MCEHTARRRVVKAMATFLWSFSWFVAPPGGRGCLNIPKPPAVRGSCALSDSACATYRPTRTLLHDSLAQFPSSGCIPHLLHSPHIRATNNGASASPPRPALSPHSLKTNNQHPLFDDHGRSGDSAVARFAVVDCRGCCFGVERLEGRTCDPLRRECHSRRSWPASSSVTRGRSLALVPVRLTAAAASLFLAADGRLEHP